MKKIGLIGCESTHAAAFAKAYNLPDENGAEHYGDLCVAAALAGEGAQELRVYGVETVYSLDELLERVDAVMITGRRGSQHKKYALPVLRAGKPLFIDKPFTSGIEDAQELADAIDASGVPVMGGSGCKLCRDVQRIRSTARQWIADRALLTGMLSFACIPDSPYDGFWFYAPHLVEMCLEIFGEEILAVSAMKNDDSLVATLRYPGFLVSLHFGRRAQQQSCVLISGAENRLYGIDIFDHIQKEAERFALLLDGQWKGMTGEELALPVYVIDAILRAAQSGGEQPFERCKSSLS